MTNCPTDARLYHFTCAHGRRDIGTGNCLLLPHLHPWLGVKLVWLTTAADADRELTGLTMNMIGCDRMAFRYVVDGAENCQPWLEWPGRSRLDPETLHAFEYREDGRHAAVDQWWISERPVRARFDRSWPPGNN